MSGLDKNETPLTDEDFSFAVWRQIFFLVVEHERQAVESGRTVQFELEVFERAAPSESIPIINLQVICEPGKPARALSVRTK